ncbi:hypothetical protein GCM10025791_44240 [Halioxenophilus aromaticivorans]|uniref:DUF2796 domain-containing protein n=1 Tax=Halioxenophilus aromaticivorans TaxID=1306992 RepID=A0AAV3U934_9ALTE
MLCTQVVLAQHSKAPHQHDHAELLIVAQSSQLQIQLRSPAANITGFEEIAQSPQQQRAVNRAKQILLTKNLFKPEPSDCESDSIDADFSSLDSGAEHHAKHEDDHDQDHDENHADVIVTYNYTCKRVAELESITTQLLTNFPAITQLNAQWVIGSRQGASTLDNSRDKIQIR